MIRDAIEREIEETHVLSDEERKEQTKEDREKHQTEELRESFRREAAVDARAWKDFEKAHGPLQEALPVDHFPEKHPYTGFARTVNVTSCPKRRQKCLQEAETWRQKRDDWITRIVGPIVSRRKRKRNLAAEADPERRRLAGGS